MFLIIRAVQSISASRRLKIKKTTVTNQEGRVCPFQYFLLLPLIWYQSTFIAWRQKNPSTRKDCKYNTRCCDISISITIAKTNIFYCLRQTLINKESTTFYQKTNLKAQCIRIPLSGKGLFYIDFFSIRVDFHNVFCHKPCPLS